MLKTQTKNIIALLLTAGMLLATGCKRDHIIVEPPPPPLCYFKFKFDGVGQYMNFDLLRYKPLYAANEVGGYQVAGTGMEPSVGLRLSWPAGDTVSEKDLMEQQGNRIHFKPGYLHLSFTYSTEAGGTDWQSVDTNTTEFYMRITRIEPLKKDTVAGVPLKMYLLTGTCNVLMSKGGATGTLSDGDFKIVIYRRDL